MGVIKVELKYIRYGIVLALLSILFGGLLGLSFGCCEDNIKSLLKEKAANVLSEKYAGKQELADKVIKNPGFILNALTSTLRPWA